MLLSPHLACDWLPHFYPEMYTQLNCHLFPITIIKFFWPCVTPLKRKLDILRAIIENVVKLHIRHKNLVQSLRTLQFFSAPPPIRDPLLIWHVCVKGGVPAVFLDQNDVYQLFSSTYVKTCVMCYKHCPTIFAVCVTNVVCTHSSSHGDKGTKAMAFNWLCRASHLPTPITLNSEHWNHAVINFHELDFTFVVTDEMEL